MNQETNRGTGAGGAQTNANGLSFEEATDISSKFTTLRTEDNGQQVVASPNGTQFLTGSKTQFHPILQRLFPDHIRMELLHGTKWPDEYYIYIDGFQAHINVIEKKTQTGSGSVCEKLQTAHAKRRRLKKMYPKCEVRYIYILAPYFRGKCPAELEDLVEDEVPYFFSDSGSYKEDVLSYMGAQ
jgi:hypothetical protein